MPTVYGVDGCHDAQWPAPARVVSVVATDVESLTWEATALSSRRPVAFSERPVLAAVGDEPVDHQDVDREDRQRPEGVGGERHQRADGAQARYCDADPAAELVAIPDREGREDLHRSQDHRHPAPGVEVADDVLGVVDEEARVADRGDPPDRV